MAANGVYNNRGLGRGSYLEVSIRCLRMTEVLLNISPGTVSALYFAVLDLITLTILDFVLSRIVCAAYYRRIHAGQALRIRSVDFPCLGQSYLIAPFLSPANIIATFLKIVFLVCIFLIDLSIDTRVAIQETKLYRSSTFVFNASDALWDNRDPTVGGLPVVRQFEQVRRCLKVSHSDNSVSFYHLAFDLVSGTQAKVTRSTSRYDFYDQTKLYRSPFMYLVPVNTTSVECLSPDFVTTSDVRVAAHVITCSQTLTPTSCKNGTSVRRQAQLRLLSGMRSTQTVQVFQPTGMPTSFAMSTFQTHDVQMIFPEYNNSRTQNLQMTCARTHIGSSRSQQLFGIHRYNACLLVAHLKGPLTMNNHGVSFHSQSYTIIERWEFDDISETLIREFPGPVFEGYLDVGLVQCTKWLSRVGGVGNWINFASSIVADAMVYQSYNSTFTRRTKRGIVTVIPTTSLMFIIASFTLVTLAYIVVMYKCRHDRRPQLNTIDGLSSIAREENFGSGRSHEQGDGVILALTLRSNVGGNKETVHFGPVRPADTVVKKARYSNEVKDHPTLWL